MEVWKSIKGWENKYSISTEGRIRNDRNGKISTGQENGNGYKKMVFWENNIPSKKVYVHRLVADAFLERPKSCTEVNHKDGNRSNNCIDNLEWVTSSGNTEHAVKNGALIPWSNPRRPIIVTNLKTGERYYFKSMTKAEQVIGTKHINQVIKGMRSHARGYTFRYAEGGDANVAI